MNFFGVFIDHKKIYDSEHSWNILVDYGIDTSLLAAIRRDWYTLRLGYVMVLYLQ